MGKWIEFRDYLFKKYQTFPDSSIVKRLKEDNSKRCICNDYYYKKGVQLNDHIHPVIFRGGKEGYYCGECGYNYLIEVAIKNE